MTTKRLSITTAISLVSFFAVQSLFAFAPKEIASYFNGPSISRVQETTATISLKQNVLADITEEEKQGIYFEYVEAKLACPAIYPTPEYCLPKKTEVGKTDVEITNLKPNTTYMVTYKRDNTIRCITTPCPENGFQSLSVEFTTKAKVINLGQIIRNIGFMYRGEQVYLLQQLLAAKGYFTVEPTGYFGSLTLQAVKSFQKEHGITPTGFVGTLTRKALSGTSTPDGARVMATTTQGQPPQGVAEMFEGFVTAYSTACFADGECSVTVSGKKVVTTIGWSQAIVGQVKGIPDFGSIEKKIGAQAKVYAQKTADGYTLYGNKDYYIEIK